MAASTEVAKSATWSSPISTSSLLSSPSSSSAFSSTSLPSLGEEPSFRSLSVGLSRSKESLLGIRFSTRGLSSRGSLRVEANVLTLVAGWREHLSPGSAPSLSACCSVKSQTYKGCYCKVSAVISRLEIGWNHQKTTSALGEIWFL